MENESNDTIQNSVKEEVVALMASDSTGWLDEHVERGGSFDAGIVWNSKRPSGTDESLSFLRKKIESGDTFNLYYSSKSVVNYRAIIIDFAENQQDLNNKNWDKKYKIMDYLSDFDDYKDNKKKARIVFLTKKIEKINSIPVSTFTFYKSFKAPTQDNLAPVKYEPTIDANPNIIEYKNPSNMKKTLASPLNQILFGPPGTGKTYNTINKALQILGVEIEAKKREEIKKLFDEKMAEGQIVFTTFHQSMGYEDFIEGIKPVMVNGAVNYEVQPGIFYTICEEAKSNYVASQSENKGKLSFDDAFEQLKGLWEQDNAMPFPLKTVGYDFIITGFTNKSVQFKKASGGSAHTLSIATLKGLYYGKELNTKGGVGIYYPGILKKLQSFKPEQPQNILPKNYVLIIDEINRGNVSQIFGELITLIEEDKRLGKGEALEVTLPYSKEKFGVPSNLYIIGTMNTADRSVEALDAALRRRFSFEEMPPKPELIAEKEAFKEKNGIDLHLLLNTINRRLEKLLDKDHRIGHSYFMSITDLEGLQTVFQKKIIPLLQEYFFGDYGKIGLVLGKGFVKQTAENDGNIFADFEGYDDAGFSERLVYTIVDVVNMSEDDFIKSVNVLLKNKGQGNVK